MGRHRGRSGVLSALVICVLALTGCAAGSATASRLPEQAEGPLPGGVTERLDAILAEAVQLSGASGAIAGVWAPWSGSWESAIGATAPTGGSPMTTDMRVRVGDLTESMTCLVLLRLVDEGRMELDDLVSDYTPRLPGLGAITLRQLCQNTSGLGDYEPRLRSSVEQNPERVWPSLEVISHGLASSRVAEPGVAFHPSSTNFAIAGRVVQRITQREWSEVYADYLFEPLGMDESSYPSPGTLALPDPHPQGLITTVDPATGGLACGTVRNETRMSNSAYNTAGGVVSTLDDLRVFVQALADGRLLSEGAYAAQWETVPLAADAPSWEGYGLGAYQYGPLRGNAGSIPGFLTAALADPESGLTVVVIVNNSTAGSEFARHLAARLASVASKAAPAEGRDDPLVALPWSEAQAAQAEVAQPICPSPA